mmetsp:Transcript_27506/g.65078  ORF Transcript_27506/g.65078 Transcript_27506/m.65078 type:complete len:248 (-) Transcript_27506:173-916(-)
MLRDMETVDPFATGATTCTPSLASMALMATRVTPCCTSTATPVRAHAAPAPFRKHTWYHPTLRSASALTTPPWRITPEVLLPATSSPGKAAHGFSASARAMASPGDVACPEARRKVAVIIRTLSALTIPVRTPPAFLIEFTSRPTSAPCTDTRIPVLSHAPVDALNQHTSITAAGARDRRPSAESARAMVVTVVSLRASGLIHPDAPATPVPFLGFVAVREQSTYDPAPREATRDRRSPGCGRARKS